MQQAAMVEYVDPRTLKAHPFNTNIYGEDGYQDLIASVKELGIQQALYVKRDRMVISGHRRWRAACEAGLDSVPVIFVSYGNELEERRAIIEHNRYRIKNGDQLYKEGKALEEIEAERAKLRQGMRTDLHPDIVENLPQCKTRDAVAHAIGLGSGRQWDKLSYIGEHRPEALKEIKPQGKSIDRVFQDVRKEVIKATAPEPLPLPVEEYDVIYADPPWQYDNQIASGGPAAIHYQTLSIPELCALKVPSAPNAVLFLWVTNPFLADALKVVEAWGFAYKTNMVWVKKDFKKGTGFYIRGRHELLYICVKGSFLPDQTGKEPIGSVIEAPVQEHSKKPEQVYGIIETMYPQGKYIELFARAKREHWASWGNQIG